VIDHRPSLNHLLLCLLVLQLACHHPARVAQTDQAPTPPNTSPDVVLTPSTPSFKFVAYGDIRFTASNALTEREASNRFARTAIIDAIAKVKPAFVTISGDIPWHGADTGDWRVFDAETKPLANAHIPILPTVGNHEYYNRLYRLHRQAGLTNYLARFPQIPHRFAAPWYSARYANCYFLFLDSEDDDSAGSPQQYWLRAQLQSLSADVDYVFAIIHRPPYTADTDAYHRPRPSEREIARILEDHQKSSLRPQIVMFAGHVHNYERYVHNGVQYIVSGGGGAHPYELKRSPDDLYKPADPAETEYHYCLVTIDHQKLKMEMHRLNDHGDPGKFTVRDSFELTVPPR